MKEKLDTKDWKSILPKSLDDPQASAFEQDLCFRYTNIRAKRLKLRFIHHSL